MLKLRISFLSFIFICLLNANYAQNFEWLINTKSFNNEFITDKCIDQLGNIYLIGNFENGISFNNDSSRNTNALFSSFLLKVDTFGNIIWLKEFYSSSFHKIILNNNKLVIYGTTRETFYSSLGNITGSNSQRRGFFIEFSLNGVQGSLKNIGIINNFSFQKLKKDLSQNIYLTGHITGNVVIDGISILKNINSLNDGVLLKFNSNLNLINQVVLPNTTIVDADFDIAGNQFLLGIYSNQISLGSYTLSNIKNDIFYSKINNLNQIIWAYRIGGVENDQASSIIFVKDKIIISGIGFKLINFNGQNFSTIPFQAQNAFLAVSDTSGKITNVKLFENSNTFLGEITSNVFNEILTIGMFDLNLKVDQKMINWPINNCLFIAKFDENLNCLWLLSLNGTGSPISVVSNNKREYFFSGTVYSHFIQMGPFLRSLFQISNYGFLVKISDISITQGKLSKREYCGGDSISMPYQKTGRFRTGNRFYLQLSNTQGMFDTLVQTIGFRTDTTSGIIQAQLPAQLTASHQYRFRIVSDSPAVTSFYDTITYSIYPSPVAKTISDTTLCFGQSVVAGKSQSNALQYLWQPGSIVSDSTAKQPAIKNNLPGGIYHIKLTAQNRHCIAKDSFSANILLPLSIHMPQKIKGCVGDIIKIEPKINGGKKEHYKALWYKNQVSNEAQDSGAILSFLADSVIKYYLRVYDGCSSPAIDSVKVYVSSYNALTLQDTTICNKSNLIWNIKADTMYNKFIWHDDRFNKLSDTNSTLMINNAQDTTWYNIINKHYCKNEPDTYQVKVNVLLPLKLQITTDATLCKHKPIQIPIQATGGKAWQYTIQLNGNRIDTATAFKYDSLNQAYIYTYSYMPQKDSILIFTLQDGCTPKTYTDTVKAKTYLPVTIKPFIPEKICNGKPTVIKSEITNGKAPFRFRWYVSATDTTLLSTADTLFVPHIIPTTYLYKVIDACNTSDSMMIKVEPNSNPVANFIIPTNEICVNQKIKPENTTNIQPEQNLLYKWQWAKNTSTSFEPEISFEDTGTYSISLIATTEKGCSDTITLQQAVKVHPKPQANFYANKQQSSIKEAIFEFTNTTQMQGEGKWHWDFGNGSTSTQQHPTIKYLQSGTYNIQLIAINQWQCSDTMVKSNYIYVEPGLTVYIPNAISVNNDGMNDAFVPIGADIKTWHMEIYNRWGVKVYECNNQTQPFTGYDMHNKPLPTDSYYYTIIVTSNDGITKLLKGSITILR